MSTAGEHKPALPKGSIWQTAKAVATVEFRLSRPDGVQP